MRNIVKYVFIFFGLLFLSSFFFVEKTYGAVYCYDDSDCGCGCNILTHTCKTCPCPSSCLCGCYPGTTSCKPQTNVNTCNCGGTLCGGCNEPTHVTCIAGSTEYLKNPDDCTYSCSCSSTCDYCCYSNGECKLSTNCSVYNSYCEDENGAGSYSIWSEVSQSCVCVEPPSTSCPSGYQQCTTGVCCPPDSICEYFSGVWRCTLGEPDPEPPASNTAPTAPTSLQTEGSTNPATVSDTTPEFSAIFNDPDTSDSSNYYQIQVNTSSDFTGTVMWNTTKTSMASTSKGSRSPQISYAGTTLTLNGSTYYWRIKFWDVGGLESPWSSTANFKMCTNVDCDPSQYCESAGWSPTRLTDESILLEDVVKCTAMVNCQSVTKYGDCYEDPGIECTKDTDCDPGECCRGYTCTTDCSPAQPCTTDSECETDKCCVGNKECGKCITPDTQSLRVIMGNKISDTVTVSLWDRILAFFRKLNMLSY